MFKNLKDQSFRIILSIAISMLLICICFYNYNYKLTQNFLEVNEEEAIKMSHFNSKVLETYLKNTAKVLEFIEDSYFSNISVITDDIKESALQKSDLLKYKIKIYTQEETKKILQETSESPSKREFYLYMPENIVNVFEVFLPMKNGNEVIGALARYIDEEEVNSILENGKNGNKFSTSIVDKNGDILFGEHFFTGDNLYKFFEQNNVKNVKTIEKEDLLYVYFEKDEEGYYLFLNQEQRGYYIVDIMPLECLKIYVYDQRKLLLETLVSVFLISFLQIIFLFYVIIKQKKIILETHILKNHELDTLINSVPGGVLKIAFDENLDILFANEGFYELTGYTKEEYIEKFDNKHINNICEQHKKQVLDKIKSIIKNKDKIEIEYRINKKNGGRAYLTLNGEYLEDIEGKPVYQCIVIDTTDYKKILNDLEVEKEQYKIIYQISDDVIFEYDILNDSIEISDKYDNIFDIDISKKDFIRTVVTQNIIYKDDIDKFMENIKQIKTKKIFEPNEIRVKNRFGKYNWVLYQGVIIKNEEGNVHKVIGKISNIDKFKTEIEDLKEKSNKDPLTKMYNKMAIENIVNQNIQQDIKKDIQSAIFIIDIDNFKTVNDTFGHIFGDAVLKEISNNIIKECTENEIPARIGGDEFVLFIKNIPSLDYLKNIAENICKIFRKTYKIQSIDYKISASIGISMYPNDGDQYKELLEKADIAVYHAKSEGKDRYKIYDENMSHISLLKIQKRENEEEAERTMKRKSVYENVLIEVSEMFLQVKDIKATINLILSILCKSYNISRACVLEISDTEKKASLTYEWCEEGIEPLGDKNIDFDEKEYLRAYNGQAFLYYDNKEELKQNNHILNYVYEIDRIKGYFACYFMEQDKIRGILSFETYKEEDRLLNEEAETIFFIARLIGYQILKYKTEQKFKTENQINEAIIDSQNLYTYIIDAKTFEILYINQRMKNEAPNMENGKLCYEGKGYDCECHYCPIKGDVDGMDNSNAKYFCEIADRWIGATYTKIKWVDDRDAYIVCAKDISEYVEQVNYTDGLTGLSSLVKFKIQAKKLLKSFEDDFQNYAIVYVDIDKFKYLNDTYGYDRGDEVLKFFAKLLSSRIKEGELLCRANDDRFLLALKYDTKEALIQRIDKFVEKMTEVRKKYFKEINFSIIGGVYLIQKGDNELNSIIDKANLARMLIKGSHKDAYNIYTEDMNQVVVKEKYIEQRMEQAIKNDEFLVYLQPKFKLNRKEVCGAEALVRWQQKDGQMIYPNDFIPIFEKNGFIVNLDLYLYEKVFIKMKEWIEKGIKIVPISLNVSRAQVNNDNFIDDVLRLIDKYNIPIDFIEFEITENIFSKDVDNLNDFIKKLRKNNFKISIDDFGSAYSSLNLLKDLNVDILKLDKGFLYSKDISDDTKKDEIIIEYIIKMAKELDLQVICEGIETNEQILFLQEVGCEIGQGYVFAKPMPIEDFEKIYLKKQDDE